ncbi:MAG: hypothetical protein ABIB11_04200 [Candidatus Omnitrophota bacterium]
MNRRALVVIVFVMVMMQSMAVYASEDRIGKGIEYSARSAFSIPSEIAKEAEQSNIINGLVVGSAKGLVATTSNACKGLIKILTFYKSNS